MHTALLSFPRVPFHYFFWPSNWSLSTGKICQLYSIVNGDKKQLFSCVMKNNMASTTNFLGIIISLKGKILPRLISSGPGPERSFIKTISYYAIKVTFTMGTTCPPQWNRTSKISLIFDSSIERSVFSNSGNRNVSLMSCPFKLFPYWTLECWHFWWLRAWDKMIKSVHSGRRPEKWSEPLQYFYYKPFHE